MKTTRLSCIAICLLAMMAFATTSNAQIQLAFTGTPTVTGTPGTLGARYEYPNVGTTGSTTIKAVVEIRSITSAGLDNIDAPGASGGTDNAFQPVIYGSEASGNCWSIGFRISFFDASNNNPIVLSSFNASGIDIDGNSGALREHNTFVYPTSYIVNNPNNLTITNTAGVYRFEAPTTSYAGISLTQTNVAVTARYTSRSFIDITLGACCRTAACNVAAGAGRQHSINFFDAVAYGAPLTTLPVTLLSFSGNREDAGSRLLWATGEETSLKQFVIQKSNDGISFTDIGSVNAGRTDKKYEFFDVTDTRGISYFRLKSVDMDGRFVYSTVVVVGRDRGGKTTLYLSPNPVTSSSSLVLEVPVRQTLDIRVIDARGQVVNRMQRNINAGSNVIPMDLKSIHGRGLYVLQVNSSIGWTESVKALLQ